jgi:hypothetical protein
MVNIDAPFTETLEKCIDEGEAIARVGWQNERMIVAQKGYPDGIGINGNTAEALDLEAGTVIKFSPYLMEFDNVTRTCQPWVPTQEDIFAMDWFVVDRD